MSKYVINKTVSTTYFTDDLSEEEKIRCAVLETLKYVRSEIKNIPITEERDLATYWDCRDK